MTVDLCLVFCQKSKEFEKNMNIKLHHLNISDAWLLYTFAFSFTLVKSYLNYS